MKTNYKIFLIVFFLAFFVGVSSSLKAQDEYFHIWHLMHQYDSLRKIPSETSLKDALKHPDQVIKLDVSNSHDKNLSKLLLNFPNLLWLNADSCDNEELGSVDWTKLKKLRHLSLCNNKITIISSTLFELDSLIFLNLSNNELRKLPENIERLSNIETLNLSHNRLKKLPENFGNLAFIRVLYLQYNDIETLPESFVKLRNSFATLDISNTKLRTLPAYLSNFCFTMDWDEPIHLIAYDLKNIKYLPDKKYIKASDLNEDYITFYNQYSWILKINAEIAQKKDSLFLLKNNLAFYNKKIEKVKDSLNGLLVNKNKELGEKDDLIFDTLIKNKIAYIIIFIFVIFSIVLIFFIVKSSRKNKQIKVAYTEINEAHTKLEQTKDELIESQKKAFISDMVVGLAHDLKTPVGSAILSSSTICAESTEINSLLHERNLSEKRLTDFRNKAFELGEQICSDMKRVAEWIESFQNITSDQVKNELKSIQLKEYLELCMRTLSYKLDKQKISYSVDVSENLWMKTHPGFISQIIINLVNNAIEHGFSNSENSQKQISIFSFLKEDKLVIVCNNNGKLIPNDILPKIFDEYFSTHKGIKGMGLSNVKRIVEQGLDGSISCQSNEKTGVTFTITLPYEKPSL